MFYDAPDPMGIFDDFLAIPSTGGNVSTTTFSDFLQSLGPLFSTEDFRLVVHWQSAVWWDTDLLGILSVFTEGVPVTNYSPVIIDAFANQTKVSRVGLLHLETGIRMLFQFWGARLWALDKNASLSSSLEPLDKGYLSHGSGSAYPPDRSHAIFPSVLNIKWSNSSLDETMAFALRNISSTIHAVALADGQNVSNAAVYVNDAIFGTPLKDMYGGNVERLRKIRAAIDPDDVMGLTGGFKF